MKRLSLLFQVSTITRSFSGFTLLLFFFNLIYLYISNRCASKLWVVLPPRTRVSLILTRGDTLVATFYLFYFCWHLRTLLKNSQPRKCRTSITNHTLFLKKLHRDSSARCKTKPICVFFFFMLHFILFILATHTYIIGT